MNQINSLVDFDPIFYLDVNPDVSNALQAGWFGSAYEHYVLFGSHEGRSPNMTFDASFYLQQYGDVASAGIVPLVHFLNYGASEGRMFNGPVSDLLDGSSQNFDSQAYLDANPDVKNAVDAGQFASAYQHFALYGQFEGRAGTSTISGYDIDGPINIDYNWESPADPSPISDIEWIANVIDTTGIFGNYLGLIQDAVIAAGEMWGAFLSGDVTIEIDVLITPTPGGTADAASSSAVYIGDDQGYNVYQQGALHKIITGVDPYPDEPDIVIRIDPGYLSGANFGDGGLYFPEDPFVTRVVPFDAVDGISVMAHEIGHGLFFNGWRDDATLEIPSFASTFDMLTIEMDGIIYFVGEKAIEAYGGPIPLTVGNTYHYGNDVGWPGHDLVDNIMNGVYFVYGEQYDIDDIDVAMLHDIIHYTESFAWA